MSTPPTAATTKALNCPNCGAALVLRSMDRALSIVCEHCHCILDAKDPNLRILQRFEAAVDEDQPLIPLGTRGKLHGTDYEVIGFQRRTITEEGIDYSWHEYLLFNPYKGFRYLTEYNGHWNDVAPATGLPTIEGGGARYLGKFYKHFQTANARTSFVLGEFPWQVRINETALCFDYVDPPYMLSAEKMDNETTWSVGEYVHGGDLWKSFKLAGAPPEAIGIFENQPSPMGAKTTQVWLIFAIMAVLIVIVMMADYTLSSRQEAFRQSYIFQPTSGQEPSFVTPVFELTGRTSDIEVATSAAINNEWIYLNYALINDDTGQAYDFGREVSYYHGYDSDGSWSEGNWHDAVFVPSIPSGHYYLRIEPESDRKFGPISYSVTVTRDVPVFSLYLIAFLAVLLPALLISWRAFNFEQMRWSESDHPRQLHLGRSDDDD
jgi:hypothetical protein